MTRPTTIYFGPDGRLNKLLQGKPKPSKVYLRSLIYSTAKRGHIIESMFVTLRRGETQQTFNIWVYGERDDLKRGSGLFVGDNGVTFNHHFTPPKDGSGYSFLPGDYQMDVYAVVIGRKNRIHLLSTQLNLSNTFSDAIRAHSDVGVHFDWGPDSDRYHAHSVGGPFGEP